MSDIGFGPVGDPPIVHDFGVRDGYDRVVRMVDRRLLEQAQARIAELEAQWTEEQERSIQWADPFLSALGLPTAWIEWGVWNAVHSDDVVAAVERLAAERDHWRAEAEKARTPAEKLRAAANVLAEYQQRHGAGCANADDLHAEADRLESEATADDVVELRGES